ncbi:MAG TPA: hypothetical protein VH679_13795 [Vicinamibacterales bacterium]|jgi:hypothetical protein
MPVFDVFLNDRKLCRAGVGPTGVLSTMVTWTKLTGAPARQARRWNYPVEETRLHVGGLRDHAHREWVARDLHPGDRVTVAIRPAGRADPAPARKPGRVVRARPDQPDYPDFHATTFLNVDLDIWSRQPLDPLVAAFGRRVVVLYCGKEGRRYGAHLELPPRGASKQRADRLIRGFAGLVRALPARARALWNQARVRDFNIGIQAAAAPHSYELPVDAKTLRAAAGVNARIVVTVYAPVPARTRPRSERA